MSFGSIVLREGHSQRERIGRPPDQLSNGSDITVSTLWFATVTEN
jgi:hypothetical protein